MLDQLLGNKQALIAKLAPMLGLDQAKAGSFLQTAIGLVEGALKNGKFDAASLLQSGTGNLIKGLDISSLTQLVGGDASKASGGLGVIVNEIMSKVQADPSALSGLLGRGSAAGLGGLGGALGGIGKMFGKP